MKFLPEGPLPASRRTRIAVVALVVCVWIAAFAAPFAKIAWVLGDEDLFTMPDGIDRDIESIQAAASLRAIAAIAARTPSGEWRRTWTGNGAWISRGSDRLFVPEWRRLWEYRDRGRAGGPTVFDGRPGVAVKASRSVCEDIVYRTRRMLPGFEFEIKVMNADTSGWMSPAPEDVRNACSLAGGKDDTLWVRMIEGDADRN